MQAEALVDTGEAIALYRQIVKSQTKYRPGLARALGSLGNYLSDMGRIADALSAASG